MEQISTEDFIRSRARLGWSRAMVREALQISHHGFREICKIMTDVEWPPRGASVLFREAQAARLGVSTPELRMASEKARKARALMAPQYKVGEFSGNCRQQYEYWREYINVSLCTVRRRVKVMSIHDALFLPPQPDCVKFKDGFWSKDT